jgi:hypothetical protein
MYCTSGDVNLFLFGSYICPQPQGKKFEKKKTLGLKIKVQSLGVKESGFEEYTHVNMLYSTY